MTEETYLQVLWMADRFYKKMYLKRVYYSGYVPISNNNRLPAIGTPVPMIRETRLDQADWLMPFYNFRVEEIVTTEHPLPDVQIDPKLGWALRNLHLFPLDINQTDFEMMIRVPGIGIQSAHKILAARKFCKLSWGHLQKMGVAINRARYFINSDTNFEKKDWQPQQIRQFILAGGQSKYQPNFSPQLTLF
jgi:predicted DNA-binding helix-hairpin-helix protein